MRMCPEPELPMLRELCAEQSMYWNSDLPLGNECPPFKKDNSPSTTSFGLQNIPNPTCSVLILPLLYVRYV